MTMEQFQGICRAIVPVIVTLLAKNGYLPGIDPATFAPELSGLIVAAAAALWSHVSKQGKVTAAPIVLLAALLLCGDAKAQGGGACDPQVIFKGLTAANFITKLSSCGEADVQAVIDDAAKAPVDNTALACVTPLQPFVKQFSTAGLLMKFQLFRRARQSGMIGNCLQWVNSTIAPIGF